MKIYQWTACAVCIAFLAVGCHDAPIGDDFADKHYKAKGTIAFAENVQVGFFDLADPDNAGMSFAVNTNGETPTSVVVHATHSNGTTVDYATVSSFPETVAITLDEMQAAFGLTRDDAVVGESVNFTFTSNAASGAYKSSEALSAPYSCGSDLVGVYDCVTEPWCDPADKFTGTSEWYEKSAGVYGIVDFAFGSFDICYGPGGSTPDGDLSVNDVCNAISITGVSQWSEVYTWKTMTINGGVMVIDWYNDYGEAGLTTLTRTDGTNWPPLTVE